MKKKIVLVAVALMGLTGAAAAADAPSAMPTKAPAAAPAFTWTGCYVGIEGGGGWGKSEHVAAAGAFTSTSITGGKFDMNGGIAGGTVGCNYQVESFVFGGENDFSWTNMKGSAADQLPFNPAATSGTRERWLDTLRGRFGFGWNKSLIYGTAGVAIADAEVNVSSPTLSTVTESKTRVGWAAGAGFEWAGWSAPWGDLTFKMEYLHAGFGNERYISPSIVTPTGATIVTRDVKLSEDLVRVGVNVKFNVGGVITAKY